jgi:hypothetical protein
MNRNPVCGEFPKFCYRAFGCERYAEQFIRNGDLRLGCLRYYREIEDASRRDPTEGSGCTREPGIVTEACFSPNPAEKTIVTGGPGFRTKHTTLTNGTFCFCMSLPDVDLNHLKNDFGGHIVEINNPRRLAEDINEYLISTGQNFIIEGCKVVYNKGQELKEPLTDNERTDLSYKQKPDSFWPDWEFRIVAIRLEPPCKDECRYLSGQFEQVEPDCKFVSVSIGKRLQYADIYGSH